jgi:hypothetical protein
VPWGYCFCFKWEATGKLRVLMFKTELHVHRQKVMFQRKQSLCFAHLKLNKIWCNWRMQGNMKQLQTPGKKRGRVKLEFLITTSVLSFPLPNAQTVFVYNYLKIKKVTLDWERNTVFPWEIKVFEILLQCLGHMSDKPAYGVFLCLIL